MKTAQDPRHKKRVRKIKLLYSYSFLKDQKKHKPIEPIIKNLYKIDKVISKCAPEWPVEKLNKIDLAILRLALYELLIEKLNPHKVVIDEAIELGKEFGSDNSPKFVNGVLGTALKK